MLLCYYVIMLLQRSSPPSTIFFNSTMQLSMYMRLTTNATILKALPRPFADNIYHFRRLSKKFPRLLSSTSKKTGGSEEIPRKCATLWGRLTASTSQTCPAAVIWTAKTTIYPRFQRPRSQYPQQGEKQAKRSVTFWYITTSQEITPYIRK